MRHGPFQYAHGTGRWSGLKRARKLLVEATECNPHFALPKYNLAKLCLGQALRTDLKPKKRRANALEALRRAEEAVEIEPEWVLARLRMFDVELQLAKHAEDLFPPEQSEAMPAPVP